MTTDSVDCVVVGSGPGGYVAAIRAAQLGMKTVVVEKEPTVGGRCLNYACIPAKAVLRAADVLGEVQGAAAFGVRVAGAPEIDFAAVQARRDTVISTLTGGVSGLLRKHGIEVIHGAGRLRGADAVVVGERTLHAAMAIVLATGSAPKPIPGLEFGGNVIATEQAWALAQLPATMAVVGAGASGTEIASAYQRLGTQVTLYEGLDRVLPTEDADVSKIAARAFAQQGIDLRVGGAYDGQDADWIVIAVGRTPDVEALGIEHLERTAHGLIAVDAAMRTSAPRVYAIGDLVPGPALAHKASDEGIVAVEAAAGLATHPIPYGDIPRATFCSPNVGSFGLTEAQARERGFAVVVGKLPYGAVGAGTIYGDRAGLVKLVGDETSGEILGAHIVGARATELIQELVSVKALEGGYPEVARTIHGHPTLSEAVMEAARAADGWLIHG